MSPRLRRSVLLPVLALALAAPAERAGSGTPQRIVSLNPSLTAILVALGAGDRLVGVDSFSAEQQAEVRALPTVGGLYNPSLEAVVALEPDLVVLVPSAEQRDFRMRLAALSIPLLVVDPVGFDEVLESILLLGDRVGRAAAARERAGAIRRVRARLARATEGRPRQRGVLVLQRDPLFVIGRGSFIAEMLETVGVANPAAAFGEPYPRVTREWLLAAEPALILDASDAGDDALAYWSRWPSLPAVREKRVVSLPAGVVTLPGPYLDRGLLRLAAEVHGAEWVAALETSPEAPGTEPEE